MARLRKHYKKPLKKIPKQKIRRLLEILEPPKQKKVSLAELARTFTAKAVFGKRLAGILDRVRSVKDYVKDLEGTVKDKEQTTDRRIKAIAKDIGSLEKKTDEVLKVIDEKTETIRKDVLTRVQSHGGGNANRQIRVNGTDVLRKYTDINLTGSITTSTDNTNQRVNIAFASGGTPGGSDTQVQFNDGGSFGGDAGFTYNKTTNTVSVGGAVEADGLLSTKTGVVLEETGAGTDTITLQAPSSIAAGYTLTLPVDDGAAGEVLQTDGNGVLSWETASVADAVILAPQTSDRNVIQSANGGVVALALKVSPNAASGAEPDTISDLALWLKADSLVLSDNDPVSTWADDSGNGRDVTQAGSLRPIYKTNIVNGEPVVRFNGSDQYLQLAQSFISGNGWTILTVTKADTSTEGVVAANDDPGQRGWALFRGNASGNVETSGTPGTAYTAGSGFDIINVAGGISIYVNGTLNAQATRSIPSNSANFDVGRRGFGSYFDGDIAEIIIYDRLLTTQERQDVTLYLSAKYGISTSIVGVLTEIQDSSGNVMGLIDNEGKIAIGQDSTDGMVSLTQRTTTTKGAVLRPIASATALLLEFQDSTGTAVGGYDGINKRFGIGTATPSYTLHVSGGVMAVDSGSGTDTLRIRDGTVVKATGDYFAWNTGIRLGTSQGQQLILGGTTVNGTNDYSIVSADKLSIYTNGYNEAVRFDTSQNMSFLGNLQYDGNTIIDMNGYVLPKSSADSSAPNNSIYYSTDASKLVYKDSGGVVNNLY